MVDDQGNVLLQLVSMLILLRYNQLTCSGWVGYNNCITNDPREGYGRQRVYNR